MLKEQVKIFGEISPCFSLKCYFVRDSVISYFVWKLGKYPVINIVFDLTQKHVH